MTAIKIIILILLFVGCYFIGLHRGCKTYKHDYDNGYLKGYQDAVDLMEEKKAEKSRAELAGQVVSQIGELFEEDKVIDCGEY